MRARLLVSRLCRVVLRPRRQVSDVTNLEIIRQNTALITYADGNTETKDTRTLRQDDTTSSAWMLARAALDATASEFACAALESFVEHLGVEAAKSILGSVLRSGVDINARNWLGRTVVYVACEEGKVQLLRVLSELGADIHARSNSGWTPAHMASLNQQASALLVLAELGAELDAVTTHEGAAQS